MATKEDADVDLPASPHNQELLKKAQALWNAHATTGVAGVPPQIRDLLNSAFAKIPVSTFPEPPVGHVIEIPSTASIGETVTTLSLNNILSAPVRNVDAPETATWSERYVGMVDFPSVVLWVLDQADLAQAAVAAGTAAATGLGAGALAALAAVAAGLAAPATIAGLTAAAVGAAIASGMAGMKGSGVQGGTAAGSVLGDDFYRVLLNEEPFKSVKVVEITRKYRWAPFLPLQPDDSMLTVLLLLSKFRMRSVPVIEMGKSEVVNLITQSAVVRGLAQCTGFDWFDVISEHSLLELGLPVMPPDKVVTVRGDEQILQAFHLCRKHGVGGVPVVDAADGRLVGNVSVRDVRYLLLKPELFGRRNSLTVQEFIAVVHADSSPADMDVTMAESPPPTPAEERESDSEAPGQPTTTAADVMAPGTTATDAEPSTGAPSAAAPAPSATAATQSTTAPTLPARDPATGEGGVGSAGSTGSDTGMKLITCGVDESLRSVIGKLAVSGVHRVIAVNDAQKVVGVLTLRDIIGCFVTEPPNYFGDFFGEALEEAVGKV